MIYQVICIIFFFCSFSLQAMRSEPRWKHRSHDGRNTPIEILLAYLHSNKNVLERIPQDTIQALFDAGVDANEQVVFMDPSNDEKIEIMTLREWMNNPHNGLPQHIVACCNTVPAVIRHIHSGKYDEACAHINKWNVQVPDAKGRFPLYYAMRCSAGQQQCTDMVRKLLEAGADARNLSNGNAVPPIGLAAFLHRWYLIPLLCAYGASPDQCCLSDKNAWHMSAICLDQISHKYRDGIVHIRNTSGNLAKTQEALLQASAAQLEAIEMHCNDANVVSVDMYEVAAHNHSNTLWWLQ